MNKVVATPFCSLILLMFLAACTAPTQTADPQPDPKPWIGRSVDVLDQHPYFSTKGMFRTTTAGGTEIRNYSHFYDFEECFQKAGGKQFGDFVEEDAFLRCSSSQVMCNHLFYIRENTVVEYAPTGRCTIDDQIQPE